MRSSSIFLPQGAVTGIGSLPFTDAQAAVTFVAQRCPEVPFWPQLPRRSVDEQMIEQALGAKREFFVLRQGTYGYHVKPGQLRACLETFSTGTAHLDEQCASGFVAFEQACAAHTFTQARAFKGQLIGPITLACSLFSEERAFLFDQDCLEVVSRWVTRLALWQGQRLQQWKLPVICFLDEPCLALLSHEPFRQRADFAIQALQMVITTLQAAGVLVGLHCCADQTSFSIMCQVAPDILSFDAYQNLEIFEKDQDARTFLKGGRLVAFGLIPTVSYLTRTNATNLFARWLMACHEMGDLSSLASQTMMTTTCGLGLLHPNQAESLFDATQRIALLVKKVAQNAET